MNEGQTPFARLRGRFDDRERRCEACGYVDAGGRWRVTAAGNTVRYRRVCPKCDAVDTREIRLE